MNSNNVEKSICDLLIVDDKPDNLRLLSAFLKAENYNVRKALNAEMALIAIASSLPDVILLDIQMPGKNGYELCSQLKKNPETKNIPIIFISGKNDVFEKGLAFDLGAVDYIVKPFHELEVLMRVKHQITIARQFKQLAEQQQKLMIKNKQLQAEIKKRKELEKKLANLLKNRFN